MAEEFSSKLYKYRSMQNESADNVEKALLQHEIYFATRNQFNDPFDCHIPVSFEVTTEELIKKYKQVSATLSTYFHLPLEADVWEVSRRLRNLTVNQKCQLFTDWNEANNRTLNSAGIFCLSSVPDDILMWSHYADSHKGICIEFDAKSLEVHGQRPSKVNYSQTEEYPLLKMTDDTDDLVNVMFLTKSAHWRYEQEWRILLARTHGVMPIPRHCITGIILGCDISDNNHDKIIQWIKQRSVSTKLYSAVKREKHFGLCIEEVQAFGPPIL